MFTCSSVLNCRFVSGSFGGFWWLCACEVKSLVLSLLAIQFGLHSKRLSVRVRSHCSALSASRAIEVGGGVIGRHCLGWAERHHRMPVPQSSRSVGQESYGVRTIPEPSAENRAAGMSSSPSASGSGASDSVSWTTVRGHLLSAGTLWLIGFGEACQFYRVIPFFKRSRPVLIKTGQCFLLNGCLFLGSIWTLQHVVIPMLRWFMGSPIQLTAESGELSARDSPTAGVLQNVIVGICYVFWLYPLYIVSFVVNIIWYNDIAKHAFHIMDKAGGKSQKIPEAQRPNPEKGAVPAKGQTATQNNSGLKSAVLLIGEQIYSVIMVSAFFLEVFAVSYIPYVGTLLNFVLLSWLYAYYCYDYKWGFARWPLERRLRFFETNWAYFAGFGSPCVLATFFFSPFVSAGVMNILFPLFVLVATASNPEKTVLKFTGKHNSRRLPIFYFANCITVPLLGLLQPAVPTMPSSIQSRKKV